MGASAFSQYTFVYLTAIDILSQHPIQADKFLREIRPTETGLIPEHPLDRCHDLYFLNTAEHFPAMLAAQVNEDLLISAATPYLGVGSDHRLIEIFEAAHSVMLAVFSVPQNSEIVARHIHPYFDALLKVCVLFSAVYRHLQVLNSHHHRSFHKICLPDNFEWLSRP